MRKPSIGRIVHYASYGSKDGEFKPEECRAAIIAGAEGSDGKTPLVVLNPNGVYFNECQHDEEISGGTWHWPERTEE